jgi:hypothetical protein
MSNMMRGTSSFQRSGVSCARGISKYQQRGVVSGDLAPLGSCRLHLSSARAHVLSVGGTINI